MKKLFPLILLAGVLLLVFSSRSTPKEDTFAKINNIEVKVKPAKTQAEIIKGLGGTQSLGDFEGMLFYLPEDTQTSFWMKGMLIPIDIIWINDGKITGIEHNAPPQPGATDSQLKLYPSPGVVDYVLEVNAGFSEKNDIKVGDSVVF